MDCSTHVVVKRQYLSDTFESEDDRAVVEQHVGWSRESRPFTDAGQILEQVNEEDDQTDQLDEAGHVRQHVQMVVIFNAGHAQRQDTDKSRPMSNGPVAIRIEISDQLD